MNIKNTFSAVGRFFKRLGMLTVLLVAIVGGAASTYLYPKYVLDTAKVAKLEKALQSVTDKEEADQRLGQYVVNLMYKSPETVKTLSPGEMQMLARNITRDVGEVMSENVNGAVREDVVQEHFFIGAVQTESRFLKYSQSPTGPKGLSQTTKATFHAALKFCGMNDVHDNDVWDADLSIYAGACYFKWLYQSYYNGVYEGTSKKICPDNEKEPILKKICAGQAASIAYNQGEASKAIKDFLKDGILREMEPAAYQGKVIFNVTTTTDSKMPNVPAFSDLPKPKPVHAAKK